MAYKHFTASRVTGSDNVVFPDEIIIKDGGLYKEGNQQLYVNVGIGFVGLPFRFGAWPEITVFTLRR